MIEVWVTRDSGKIAAYRVEGHAGTAKAGRDIVCSAVSALVIAAENGLEEVAGIKVQAECSDGKLEVRLGNKPSEEADVKADAILETMLNALRRISSQYPGAIRIYE